MFSLREKWRNKLNNDIYLYRLLWCVHSIVDNVMKVEDRVKEKDSSPPSSHRALHAGLAAVA